MKNLSCPKPTPEPTKQIKFTVKEVESNAGKICGIRKQVGKLANLPPTSCWKHENKLSGGFRYFVVSADSYRKYRGAQLATCYGKKDVDYFEFESAKDAVKYANQILKHT